MFVCDYPQVIWHQLVNCNSAAEKGTLWQLCNLLGRSAVMLDPSRNVKVAEDFLTLILHAHVITAAETLSEKSSEPLKLEELAQDIVASFVASFVTLRHSTQTPTSATSTVDDGILVYAKEVMTLSLIWHVFHDSIQEGDGDRVMRYWKVLLLLFKAGNHKNYSLEAMRLLLQQMYLTSPRKSAQLKWSRFINVQGQKGCNMPAELHMEHLNRRFKNNFKALQSNITDKTIDRIGRSVGIVQHISKSFLEEIHMKEDTGRHRPPSFTKDLELVANCLQEAQIFKYTPLRRFNTFKHTAGVLQRFDMTKLTTWLRVNNYYCQ